MFSTKVSVFLAAAFVGIHMQGCGGDEALPQAPLKKTVNCKAETDLLCKALERKATKGFSAGGAEAHTSFAEKKRMGKGGAVDAPDSSESSSMYPVPRNWHQMCYELPKIVQACEAKCSAYESDVEGDFYGLRMCLVRTLVLEGMYTYSGGVHCSNYIHGVCDKGDPGRDELNPEEKMKVNRDPINVGHWCKSEKMRDILISRCEQWCPRKQDPNGVVPQYEVDQGAGKPGLDHSSFTACVVKLEDHLIATGEYDQEVAAVEANSGLATANASASPAGPAAAPAAPDEEEENEPEIEEEATPEGSDRESMEEGDEQESSQDTDKGGPAAEEEEAPPPDAEEEAPPPDAEEEAAPPAADDEDGDGAAAAPADDEDGDGAADATADDEDGDGAADATADDEDGEGAPEGGEAADDADPDSLVQTKATKPKVEVPEPPPPQRWARAVLPSGDVSTKQT